jgi:hypothetical protein
MRCMTQLRTWLGRAGLLAVLLPLLAAGPVGAQSPAPGALPTAPGAERAGQPGTSPLEPYLITWLLPVSGLLTVLAGFYVDRRVRVVDRRRELASRQK